MGRVMQCPKCHSRSFQLHETFTQVETRDVVDGVVSKESSIWPDGLLRTDCECSDCNHQWVPRQATLNELERP